MFKIFTRRVKKDNTENDLELLQEYKEYNTRAKEYYNSKRVEIVDFIWSMRNSDDLQITEFEKILGADFPKVHCAWKNDKSTQIKNFLDVVGLRFEIYYDNIDLDYYFRNYSGVVQTYLKFYGMEIVEKLSDYCSKKGGRISYEDARDIFGIHYPKISFAFSADEKTCLLLFLFEARMIFRYDEDSLYFP